MKKIASVFLAMTLALDAGAAQRSKISSDAAAVDPQAVVDVIVQWGIPVGAATNQIITSLGGTTVSEFKSLGQGVYRLSAPAVTSLGSHPDVKYVSIDRKLAHKLDNTAAAANASAAWNAGWTGTGVGVAVIDSGINADSNLSNVAYTEDFTGTGGKHPGQDAFGHGQHVAGIIASNGSGTSNPKGPISSYNRKFIGIAPGARLIDLRVLDETGKGSDSQVIAAIDRAISLKATYNIRVINISLGRPVYESYTVDPLCQAVEAAWKSGIVVVVAAGNEGRNNTYGNEGYGTITAPGNDPYVITVGAMKTGGTYSRSDDLIASYSSKGPSAVDHVVKPDLVAPGNRVVSLRASGGTLSTQNPANTVLQSYYANTNNGQAQKTSGNFFMLSGTSMAAPVVSGAAADLLQAKPSLTPDQIKLLLMQTAYKTFPSSSTVIDSTTNQSFTSYYDLFTVGAGYLDLGAAFASINDVPTGCSALSPTAIYDHLTGVVTLSYDPSSVFSNKAISGTKVRWGAQSVWNSSVLNADKVMWGANTSSATRALWGATTGWAASSTTGAESTTVSINGEP